jgi:indolepyruvate ferredoxin oxidoreductase alpha subunit
MEKRLLLGNEAIAYAIYHSGAFGTAYPGTPATEIQETLIRLYKKHPDANSLARWSINEKVAFERAIGLSFAGRRVAVSFKHVGLNVALDPFMSSAIVGTPGLVVISADDPGMHSSQNEQDSRVLADFAMIPCLEPSNSQEAYDMTKKAFEISEELELPVMIRMVTRTSHVRGNITLGEKPEQIHQRKVAKDPKKWVVLPAFARPNYQKLLEKKIPLQHKLSDESEFNQLVLRGKKRGIIACGNAFNYVMENDDGDFSYLKIGTYPLPVEKIKELANQVEELVVVEEGYPFVEKQLPAVLYGGPKISGKFDGNVPRFGELHPTSLFKLFNGKKPPEPKPLPVRPPALCKGCPHDDTFYALEDALDGNEFYAFSDIGCYTLGLLKPHKIGDVVICMGASISGGIGASEGGLKKVISVIGDSTFTHSGLTGLAEAVHNNSNLTLFILDNCGTAMTGGQPTLTPNQTLEKMVAGLGVNSEHLKIITPLKRYRQTNSEIIKRQLEHKGVSVIIARRACVQLKKESSD